MKKHNTMLMLAALLIGIAQQTFAQTCPARDEAAALAEDQSRNCRSECNVTADCTGVKTCNCDDLCGMSCFNLDADCDALTLTDGTISYSDGQNYNSQATHECDSGFYLSGQEVRICRSTRAWSHSHEVPSCKPKLCTSSPSIANGSATDCAGIVVIGGTCALLCDSGFSMTGVAVATCTDDGDGDIEATWDIGNSSCEVVLCTSSPSIANGEATDCAGSAFIGGTCALLCYSGFSMTGAAVATCTDDGDGDVEAIWDIGNFSCEPDATLPEPDEPTTAVGGRTSTVQPGSTTITTATESSTMSTTTSTNEGFALPADYIYPIAVGLSALFCYGV